MHKERIILGIDPGTTIMGYGIIKSNSGSVNILSFGIIELYKYSNHYIKLQKIFDRTIQLIEQYHPDELAIEAPFYGKNVQSMLKLGRAQGVAIAAALNRSIPIFEYAPRKIKLAITGNGNASKEQVARFLQKLLDIKELPAKLDATDGLAVALCHLYQNKIITPNSGAKSWKDYINKNPGKLLK
ncbi:MAG: crossover junction endodeoxyribonuclease RuvC [Bacteroidales bacterium]|nr:crossover junction endodeoxyribonuclease RuvC [Bacteroidales bacterium]